MVAATSTPPALSGELELFHTIDPLLYNSPLVVFYGAAATIVSASSRIQVHIFTPAGLESYTRLAISPSSPHYSAVNALPREEQGDEVCRGIAFALSKYYAELPRDTREALIAQASAGKRPASPFGLFSPTHVAVLASRMTRVENTQSVIEDIQRALGEQDVSWLDLDVALPAGSIQSTQDGYDESDTLSEEDLCQQKYGKYGALIHALGETAFLPTSKMKRAPSRPTALGRSQIFRPGQKETIRKEMCELVDTEASYVQKLTELVFGVAHELRETTENTAVPVQSATQRAIQKLFPPSLDRMAKTNGAFFESIRTILDETEEAAIAEIERDNAMDTNIRPSSANGTQPDVIGVQQFATCLLKYLPDFKSDYAEYMTAHAKFPLLLKQIMKSADSDIIGKVQEIGEQRLTSMLIEPVQRLPRYTLYIDTISKQLPVGHPALRPLLKARDIVSDICLSDGSAAQPEDVEARLRSMIKDWPRETMALGRLVSVADAVELLQPCDEQRDRGQSGMILVFTQKVIVLEKISNNALSARSLQAELEKPMSTDTTDSMRPRTPQGLSFDYDTSLHTTIFSECLDGKALSIWRKPSEDDKTAAFAPSVWLLEATYTGKAIRLTEEVTKARVEGRFSESERENGKWDVRNAFASPGELNLFLAVFEDREDLGTACGKVRLVVEPEKHTDLARLGKLGVETLASMKILGDGSCQLSVDSIHGLNTRDRTSMGDVLPILSRRLTTLLQLQLSIKNTGLTASLIARNNDILRSLQLVTAEAEARPAKPAVTEHSRTHRPHSPVKTLSTFLSSIGPGPPPSAQKKLFTADSIIANAPNLQPMALPPTSRPTSKDDSRPVSKENLNSPRKDTHGNSETAHPSKRMEDILTTYLLALQARKGNVVGRTIKARANANELAVNELYNSLLEDSNMMVLAAQASVDVLFVAFEKFVNVAWREKYGSIVSRPTLEAILEKAETSFPTDFESHFREIFHTMTPQNQRALRGIIKLLAELLDGTGNDGDRGILTAAFAELLVPDDSPYAFVSLIDRFVEDIEPLFGETVRIREVESVTNPSSGHQRSRSVNTGSLTSNTSSLRKKFGFGGVSRENSVSQQDSKVGSVWRTLSKNKQGLEQPPYTPRATVQRAKSTDIDVRLQTRRPTSQDRPAVLGAFPFERPTSQDSNTVMQTSPLSTIGEKRETPGTGPPRKKRRSSLSDLTFLQSPGNTPVKSPADGTKRSDAIHSTRETQSHLASLSKATSTSTPTRLGSPIRNVPRSRLPSSFRKENSPGPKQDAPVAVSRPRSSSKQPEETVVTSQLPRKRNDSVSNIPSPAQRIERTASTMKTPSRPGLSERPTSGNAQKIKPFSIPEDTSKPSASPAPSCATITATATPTKKLRVQSPQKLRERLQAEQRAITTSNSTLEAELSKISTDLSALGPGRMGSVRASSRPPPSPNSSTAATDISALQTRVTELSGLLHTTLSTLTSRTEAISTDLSSSLSVSESKARKLDELYRAANAENEALYARFNEELGNVVKAVRAGDGLEELKRRVKEGHEEREGLRRENARLRREVVGLRSQLRE